MTIFFKNLFFLSLLLTCLFACKPNESKSQTKQKSVDNNLFQFWRYSYEESSNDVKVYRPVSYNFPPSRGRDGFEIKANGEYITHTNGPADEPLQIAGKWKKIKENVYEITVNNTQEKKTIEIISLQKEKLLLKNQ